MEEKKQKILIEELLFPGRDKRIPRTQILHLWNQHRILPNYRAAENKSEGKRYWFVDENFNLIEREIMNDQVQRLKNSKPDCWRTHRGLQEIRWRTKSIYSN